jgi:hypothetical protein
MAFLYPAWWPGALKKCQTLGNSRISHLWEAGNTGEGGGAVPSNNFSRK